MTERNLGDRAAVISGLGLTIESTFIPFSQSRNKSEKSPSLNWAISLKKDGRPILVTDYSAGCAHCPSYNAKAPTGWDENPRNWQPRVLAWECEHGKKARFASFMSNTFQGSGETLQPDAEAVVWSFVMDSDVIDAGGFESWASNFGYDTDSRKAETTYRACLDIALKLRAAIGDSGLQALRNAFEGY